MYDLGYIQYYDKFDYRLLHPGFILLKTQKDKIKIIELVKLSPKRPKYLCIRKVII